MTDEHRPQTAQARYVAKFLDRLDPDKVATLTAEPPGNRAKEMGFAQIHTMVMGHATDADKDRWVDLMIDATGVEHKEGWSTTWSTPIARALGIELDPPAAEVKTERPKRAPAEPVANLDDARQAA